MQTDPLQQLRGLIPPEPPGWWPPAPGWWILATLLVAAISWGMLAWRDRYRRLAPLHAARAEHERLQAALAAEQLTPAAYLHDCNGLLKRVALYVLGAKDSAPLSGSAWLQALDQVLGNTAFSDGPGVALSHDRFAAGPVTVDPALTALIDDYFCAAAALQQRRWVRSWLPVRNNRSAQMEGERAA